MKVVFLDIDGVLNGHEFDAGAQSNTIRRDCVLRFNRLLAESGASVVLSSAWRYMILGNAMTLGGFTYMLQTHGVAGLKLIGHTVSDEEIPDRGDQIKEWLSRHPEVETFAVLDDLAVNVPFLVQTHSELGLIDEDVELALSIFFHCIPAATR